MNEEYREQYLMHYGVKGDVNTTIVGFNGKRIYNGEVNVITEG